MIWFFERGDEAALFEVRRRDSHFEIAVRRPGGRETVHVVHSATELFADLETAPRRLFAEGWRPRPVDPVVAILGLTPAPAHS